MKIENQIRIFEPNKNSAIFQENIKKWRKNHTSLLDDKKNE